MTTFLTEVQLDDTVAQTGFDAICTRFGYTGFDVNKEPQTPQEFVQAYIMKHLFEQIASHVTATVAAIAATTKAEELNTTLKDVFVKKEIIKLDETGDVSPIVIDTP